MGTAAQVVALVLGIVGLAVLLVLAVGLVVYLATRSRHTQRAVNRQTASQLLTLLNESTKHCQKEAERLGGGRDWCGHQLRVELHRRMMELRNLDDKPLSAAPPAPDGDSEDTQIIEMVPDYPRHDYDDEPGRY